LLDLPDVLAGTFHACDGLTDPNSMVAGYVSGARRLGAQLARRRGGAPERGVAIAEQLSSPIDKLGEQHFRAGLNSVEQETESARLVLLWVVGGLALVGMMLAFAAVRMISELRRLNARERAAAQARADFLVDIAHELRTPLTVLRTNADLGLSLDPDEPHTPLFSEIVNESVHMTRMLQDLLLLARSDSVALPLEREAVQMAPFVADVAARAQTLAHERGAILEVQLLGEGQLSIDRARVEQVVLILVDNALKYGPPGNSITLRTSVTADEASIEVADRGFGIPQDELPYVFDRFYRADRSRPRVRKVDGAGLGLSIARTIVEAHGGRIAAASRPGGGTRMTVRLPVVSALSPAVRLLTGRRATGRTDPRGSATLR
jgi:signal transduction histidine kinase